MHRLNPFLWITICIVVSNGLLDKKVDPDSRDLSSSEYDQNLKSEFANSQSFTKYLRRARNANDKSSEYLNHITSIAHITNGIALQNGLMNGNVPIDSVIEEFLNLGTVKLSSVIQFKTDSIKNFGTKLKGVTGKFDGSAAELEKQALKWNKWYNKYLAVKDVTFDKIPRSSEYFSGAKTINSSTILENFKKLIKSMSSISKCIFVIENDVKENLDDIFLGLLFINFKGINQYIQTFASSVNAIEKEIREKLSQSLLKEGHVIFQSLESMLEVMKGRKVDVQSTDALITTIKTNVKIAAGLAKDSTAADTDISLITDLMKSQNVRKPNKHTIGFPNGASDMKQLKRDAVDSWIAKILNLDVTRLNALWDSLFPLFQINEKLDDLDEKMRSIVSDNSYESLLKLQEIQKELAAVSDKSIVSIDVLKVYDTCFDIPRPDDTDFKISEDFIANVHLLTNKLIDIEALIHVLKDDPLKQEVDEYLKSLGFTNIVDEPTVRSQLPEAVKRYNAGNNLDKIKKHINEIQSKFAVVNGADLQSKLSSVAAASGKFIDKNFNDEISTLGKIHDCLKDHLASSDKSSKAILAIHMLQDLEMSDIDNVTTLATAISDLSKSLIGIKSIPDEMNKIAKNVTVDINKLDNSMAKSRAVGQSVVSLKQVYELKQLKMEIAHLKSLRDTVEVEIRNVASLKEKVVIRNEWGDHKKDIYDLENFLAEIESFDTELDVSKATTMEEYGNPLKELATFSDVKIDFYKKANALRSLINQPTINSNVTSDLEMAQETLEKLSKLDLLFSKYRTKYSRAPSDLRGLHEFLVQFLTPEAVNTVIIGNNDKYYYVAIGIIFFAVFVAVVVLVLLYCNLLCFKDRSLCSVVDMDAEDKTVEPLTEDLIVIMICKHILLTHLQFFELWAELVRTVMNEDRSEHRRFPYVSLGHRKYWSFEIKLNPGTAAQSIRMHANVFVTRLKNIFTVAQGPMYASDSHDDTRVDFLSLIIKDESEYAVMIGQAQSADGPKNPNLCAAYFSQGPGGSVKIGPFTVETLDEAPFMNQGTAQIDVTLRTLKITDKRKKKVSRTIKHFHMPTWNDEDIPPFGYETCYQVMQTLIKSKFQSENILIIFQKPILVHNTKGVGSAMAFVGLEYTSRMMEYHEEYTYKDAFRKLIEKRYCSFQNVRQIGWMHVGSVYFTTRNYDLDPYMYEQMQKTFSEMIEKGTGVPADQNGIKWMN
ncbi:hypothetical protein CRE_20522 [Caenorhabditis remanei]|uniref:Tyrosine-protein phosphatase domain-containing protein n=1 Tax=Caenorhabditis remanei TaxID=31234 RepID=E3N8A4_CAERE|nr:hypothetical protein CRE_20522 [Caenorhabditis remanei]